MNDGDMVFCFQVGCALHAADLNSFLKNAKEFSHHPVTVAVAVRVLVHCHQPS